MKLFRIQNDTNKRGLWSSGLMCRYQNIAKSECLEMSCDMAEELHAPRDFEFSIDDIHNLPSEAIFYFKEDFWNKYKPLFDDIKSKNLEGFEIVEIELDTVSEYTMYYQDINQCCIFIKGKTTT